MINNASIQLERTNSFSKNYKPSVLAAALDMTPPVLDAVVGMTLVLNVVGMTPVLNVVVGMTHVLDAVGMTPSVVAVVVGMTSVLDAAVGMTPSVVVSLPNNR